MYTSRSQAGAWKTVVWVHELPPTPANAPMEIDVSILSYNLFFKYAPSVAGGCATAEPVTQPLPTVGARIRSQGVRGGQSSTGKCF
jgi:hypothetical protein